MHICIVKNEDDRRNSVQRIQSTAIFQGLMEVSANDQPAISAEMVTLTNSLSITTMPSHLLFHFFDTNAARAVFDFKKRFPHVIAVCLGTDIYQPQLYTSLSGFVDLYLMPTKLHRDVLKYFVDKRVEYLPESVDPIALGVGEREQNCNATADKICWFGYPESYKKSLGNMINDLIAEGTLKNSDLLFISSLDGDVGKGIPQKYFNIESFYADTADCRYSILSHFCLDLHINTFIKSPNKMITSIVRGMIPIASRTPSYLELIEHYNLDSHSFSSKSELRDVIKRLSFDTDYQTLNMDAIRADLLRTFSYEAVARALLAIL